MRHSAFLWCAATAALAAVLGVSGCATSTTNHPESATPSATEGATASVKGIPLYRPSSVRLHTASSATLTSPDPVTKVTNYYLDVVRTGGWTTVSKSVSSRNGNLTIKKSGQGATISVAPSGSGSVIHISAYPTA